MAEEWIADDNNERNENFESKCLNMKQKVK
jgi:hypothetical protein